MGVISKDRPWDSDPHILKRSKQKSVRSCFSARQCQYPRTMLVWHESNPIRMDGSRYLEKVRGRDHFTPSDRRVSRFANDSRGYGPLIYLFTQGTTGSLKINNLHDGKIRNTLRAQAGGKKISNPKRDDTCPVRHRGMCTAQSRLLSVIPTMTI